MGLAWDLFGFYSCRMQSPSQLLRAEQCCPHLVMQTRSCPHNGQGLSGPLAGQLTWEWAGT